VTLVTGFCQDMKAIAGGSSCVPSPTEDPLRLEWVQLSEVSARGDESWTDCRSFVIGRGR